MLGAIVGDIIGYFYEWNNVKTLDFDLFPKEVTFTDDTVMTLAVAKWLIEEKIIQMQVLLRPCRN